MLQVVPGPGDDRPAGHHRELRGMGRGGGLGRGRSTGGRAGLVLQLGGGDGGGRSSYILRGMISSSGLMLGPGFILTWAEKKTFTIRELFLLT